MEQNELFHYVSCVLLAYVQCRQSFSYLSSSLLHSQNFFPEQMVAWCQESNGSIPQSQLLQVRNARKCICDTAKSGLAYIVTRVRHSLHDCVFAEWAKWIQTAFEMHTHVLW